MLHSKSLVLNGDCVCRNIYDMPASSSKENLLDETFESTQTCDLPEESHINKGFQSTSRTALSHQIEFHLATKPYVVQIDSLKAKYILLNSTDKEGNTNSNAIDNNDPNMNGDSDGVGMPEPQIVLYSPHNITLAWSKRRPVGGGFINNGTTCYMNAVFQCMCYLPSLGNYIFGPDHQRSCKIPGFCMLCELSKIVKLSYANHGRNTPLTFFFNKMRYFSSNLRVNRQEDAHEFLRQVVEGMQKSCLYGYNRLDRFSKETTVANQIFGGFLRSQIQCSVCDHKSNTYEPYLDLSLDIKGVNNLQEALEKFVHAEILDKDNAYMCPVCRKKVAAQKRFTVHKASNVLTIHLKRFQYHHSIGKIVKKIHFPHKLDVRPYMSITAGKPVEYELTGIIVHEGAACSSGHYYAIVKTPLDGWRVLNDDKILPCTQPLKATAGAYMLFYSRIPDDGRPKPLVNLAPTYSNHIYTSKSKNYVNMNGSASKVNGDYGVPLRRPIASATLPAQAVVNTNTNSQKPSNLPDKRDKVSFGIRQQILSKQSPVKNQPKQKPVQNQTKQSPVRDQAKQSPVRNQAKQSPVHENVAEKPRIVMQIKNGKVTTFEKSPNGQSKIVNGHDVRESKSNLVPYGTDSESEDEDDDSVTPSQSSSSVKASGSQSIIQGSSSVHSTASVPSATSVHNDRNDYRPINTELDATISVPGNTNLLKTVDRADVTRENRNFNLMMKKNRELPYCVGSYEVVNSSSQWHTQDNANNSNSALSKSNENLKSPKVRKDTENIAGGKAQHIQHGNTHNGNKAANVSTSGNLVNGFLSKSEKEHLSEFKKVQKVHKDNAGSATPLAKSDLHISKAHTPVNISDKQHLLSESDHSDSVEHKVKKNKKHKHKHKKRKHTEVDESESIAEPSKKKHKKHKHKDSKKEHKKKESVSAVHIPQENYKRARTDSISSGSSDYEWIEKTKDSVPQAPAAMTQRWDHHIGGHNKHHTSTAKHNGSTDNTRLGWDGTKSSSVATQLEKQSSLFGYGAKVMSWDGHQSHIDQEIQLDLQRNKKRNWSDDYEEELDMGHTKKAKKSYSSPILTQGNPFQTVQDDRNYVDSFKYKNADNASLHGYASSTQLFRGCGNGYKDAHATNNGYGAHTIISPFNRH